MSGPFVEVLAVRAIASRLHINLDGFTTSRQGAFMAVSGNNCCARGHVSLERPCTQANCLAMNAVHLQSAKWQLAPKWSSIRTGSCAQRHEHAGRVGNHRQCVWMSGTRETSSNKVWWTEASWLLSMFIVSKQNGFFTTITPAISYITGASAKSRF